eukprot:1158137-Pelagomonas_calceolata.AAC.7
MAMEGSHGKSNRHAYAQDCLFEILQRRLARRSDTFSSSSDPPSNPFSIGAPMPSCKTTSISTQGFPMTWPLCQGRDVGAQSPIQSATIA